MKLWIAGLALILGCANGAWANDAKGEGPCHQIREACEHAGFVKGDWKKGDGLWRDCVDPIMQGVTNVPGATKPLPTVDPALVSACKAKNPKFGHGKVGSVGNAAGATTK